MKRARDRHENGQGGKEGRACGSTSSYTFRLIRTFSHLLPSTTTYAYEKQVATLPQLARNPACVGKEKKAAAARGLTVSNDFIRPLHLVAELCGCWALFVASRRRRPLHHHRPLHLRLRPGSYETLSPFWAFVWVFSAGLAACHVHQTVVARGWTEG